MVLDVDTDPMLSQLRDKIIQDQLLRRTDLLMLLPCLQYLPTLHTTRFPYSDPSIHRPFPMKESMI